jgi:hypothetical protein
MPHDVIFYARNPIDAMRFLFPQQQPNGSFFLKDGTLTAQFCPPTMRHDRNFSSSHSQPHKGNQKPKGNTEGTVIRIVRVVIQGRLSP